MDNLEKVDKFAKLRQNVYYILIGVLSFLVLAFLPMLGSNINAGWNFPETTSGWVLWVMTKLAVCTINMLIFHCFIKQGDINTKRDSDRIKAEQMLAILENKKDNPIVPLSPKQFLSREYGKKLPTLILTSVLSLIAFGPALFMFDAVVFCSYLFTVVMAIVFGVLEMKKVEEYYCVDLLKYAEYRVEKDEKDRQAVEQAQIQKAQYEREMAELQRKYQAQMAQSMAMAQNQRVYQGYDTMGNNSGTNILASQHSNGPVSSNSQSVVVDSVLGNNSVLERPTYPCNAPTNQPGVSTQGNIQQN